MPDRTDITYPEESRLAEMEKSLFSDETAPEDIGNSAPATPELQKPPDGQVGSTPPPIGEPPAAAPTDSPKEQPPAAPDAAEEYRRKYDDLQHNFEVLKGRIDAEGPRNAEEIRKLKAEKTQLEQELLAQKQAREQKPPEPEFDLEKELKALDQHEPGSDEWVRAQAALTMKIAEQAAMKNTRGHVDDLQTQLAEMKKSVEQMNHARLQDAVSRQVPNYAELEKEPEYGLMMSKLDPFSGRSYGELFRNALAERDPDRLVSFYKFYEQSKTLAAPPAPPAEKPPPPAPTAEQREAIAKQAVPSAKSATSAEPVAGRRYTLGQYKAIQAKLQSGGYKPEEETRVEAEIFQAVLDGRVDGLLPR